MTTLLTPPSGADGWLDRAEKLSRTVSIAAIPVVLAAGGWMIQRQIQSQAIARDYVQLALSILQNPDRSKVPPELRDWAVDLLNENSPTKLNEAAKNRLKSGAVTLPSLSFVPSSALTTGLQQQLTNSLERVQDYMVNLGFPRTAPTINVEIAPGTTVKANDSEGVAFWLPEKRLILVASAFANDEVSVLRQFAHEFLKPGDPRRETYAIESGLATYFPCSLSNHPVLGDRVSDEGKRIFPPLDLRNRRLVSDIKPTDWTSVQIDGSQIWGGIFWEVRGLIGDRGADRLLAETWRGFSSGGGTGNAYAAFAAGLMERSKTIEGGKYTSPLKAVLTARGLRFRAAIPPALRVRICGARSTAPRRLSCTGRSRSPRKGRVTSPLPPAFGSRQDPVLAWHGSLPGSSLPALDAHRGFEGPVQ